MKKQTVWYVQWFYDFVSISILGCMIMGFGLLTLNAVVATQEKSDFRRGVECSVYWQDSKCGPRYEQVYVQHDQEISRAPAVLQ